MADNDVDKMRIFMETLTYLCETPDRPFIRQQSHNPNGTVVKLNPNKMRSRIIPNSIDGQRGLAMEQHLSDAIEELQQIEDISKVSPEQKDAIIGMAEVILQSFRE